MRNIEEAVVILLKRVSVQDILNERITYDNWREEDFVRISAEYMKQYSMSELRFLYRYLAEYVQGRASAQDDRFLIDTPLDFYDIVFFLSEKFLNFSGNRVTVNYGNLLEWRRLTTQISEDVFNCAYVADRGKAEEYGNLGWDVVIGHNNVHLTRILEKGISENHFHLWASAPYFHLAWVTMMNSSGDGIYRELFAEMDLNKQYVNSSYEKSYREMPFRILHLQAMLLRVYLYCWLKDIPMAGSGYFSGQGAFWNVKKLLESPEDMYWYADEIVAVIRGLRSYRARSWDGYEGLEDYVQDGLDMMNGLPDAERLCCGERWFLCHMFARIADDGRQFMEQYNWFYAYLSIKEAFRSELVQVNERIGLLNFQKYSGRKGRLPVRQDLISGMALRDTLRCPYLQYLEARITPCNSARENRDYVEMLDSMIGESDRERCFYVFHFVRMEDRTSESMMDISCRHQIGRSMVKKQAEALVRFREKYPETAMRVRGVDVCAGEIGCRPEVFAQAFRYLRNHVACMEGWNSVRTVPQLRVTYHIGEDFLDVVDGLRSIDEAIRFMDMDCGDRFGHAIVLGIDVGKWYHEKNYRVLMPEQDYIDNLAWMYGRIISFRIDGMENFLHYLEEEFEYHFRQVYSQSIPTGNMDFSIKVYYYAEQLRGDAPECYWNGKCEKPDVCLGRYDEYALNDRKAEKKNYRTIPEAAILYHRYHYDSEVKRKGRQIREINISSLWIKGVTLLQKEMQHFVANHGIAIETNPSSNFLISGIQKYDEHPIVKLYNRHLVSDPGKLSECAQLSVSINTDDKGIFATSLENEYALMACALEQHRDTGDHMVYDRTMIYEWLDKVREFGNMQSFGGK